MRINNRKRKTSKKKSEIRIVKRRDTRKKPLMRKARLRRKRIYQRRRRILAILSILIIAIPITLLTKKLNSYSKMGYPKFRDEVLEGLGNNVLVADSKGRSLTSAEKLSDFDKLVESISRSYPITKENKANFDKFVKGKDELRKRVKNSKTDQEYFDILNESVSLLEDSSSFILDKDSYSNLFSAYRNKKDSKKAEILGDDQAVDRYKRMINKENVQKDITINHAGPNLLIVKIPRFNRNKLDDDLDLIAKALNKGNVEAIAFDLSDNNSIDNYYVNDFVSYFIDKDYEEKDLYFYRSALFEESLDDIKSSENSSYTTAKVKNLASKFNGESKKFNTNDYLYYDEIDLKIKKKDDFRKRKIYVLTNENTANQAIRMAAILKDNGGYTIKNALDAKQNPKDRIDYMPPDLILLDHSGLILSLRSNVNLGDDRFITYDQRINSENPDKALVDIIK